jgi:hypothetical protein
MTTFLDAFANRFSDLHYRSTRIIELTACEDLFRRPREIDRAFAIFSIGEYVIRSAAIVEQTFGGITTRLWDDPFEWTLPEKLSDNGLVIGYLNEVEETRRRGLGFLGTDSELKKELPAPEKLNTIFDLLLGTLTRAEHYQGGAYAVFQLFYDRKLPPI